VLIAAVLSTVWKNVIRSFHQPFAYHGAIASYLMMMVMMWQWAPSNIHKKASHWGSSSNKKKRRRRKGS